MSGSVLSDSSRQSTLTILKDNLSSALSGLVFGGMTAHEKLGRPFAYQVTVYTADSGNVAFPTVLSESDLNTLMASQINVSLDYSKSDLNMGKRFFHGHVHTVSYQGQVSGTGIMIYELEVVPSVSLLKHTRQCRIFKNLNYPDIISNILSNAGLTENTDFSFALVNADHPKHEMTVQYNESDFDFIHRLMESEGIYYRFEHSADQHLMVLCNANNNNPSIFTPLSNDNTGYTRPDTSTLVQYTLASSWNVLTTGVWNFTCSRQQSATSITGQFYDWQNASTQHKVNAQSIYNSPPDYANQQNWRNIQQYPLGQMCTAEGQSNSSWNGVSQAGLMTNRIQRASQSHVAMGNLRYLQCGFSYTMAGHPISAENQEYLITEATYYVATEAYPVSTRVKLETGIDESIFAAHYKIIPNSMTFTPDQITDTPSIDGVQSAKVVNGGTAATVDTDAYGRVLVQFHWNDSNKALNSNNSQQITAYARVSQIWAGKVRGALFTPRVGDEVLVAFQNGDPDYPIVVGSVYNSDNEPFIAPDQYPLVSGIRSRVATTESTTLDDSYKNIQHSDLLFDDHDSSKTTGVQLRSFCFNGAGQNYNFDGDSTNPNLKKNVAGFTVFGPDSKNPEMHLTLNVGKDVTTKYQGNQKFSLADPIGAAKALVDKQVYTKVGPATTSKWQLHNNSHFAVYSELKGIWSATIDNPTNQIKVGPTGIGVESLFGTIKLRSGVPSETFYRTTLALRELKWLSYITTGFNNALSGPMELTRCMGLIGDTASAVTTTMGLVKMVYDKCQEGDGIYTGKASSEGQIKIKGGAIENKCTAWDGAVTRNVLNKKLFYVESESTAHQATRLSLMPEGLNILTGVVAGTTLDGSSFSFGAKKLEASIDEESSRFVIDEEQAIMRIGDGAGKFVLKTTEAGMTTCGGDSMMAISSTAFGAFIDDAKYAISTSNQGAGMMTPDGGYFVSPAGLDLKTDGVANVKASLFNLKADAVNLNGAPVSEVAEPMVQAGNVELNSDVIELMYATDNQLIEYAAMDAERQVSIDEQVLEYITLDITEEVTIGGDDDLP